MLPSLGLAAISGIFYPIAALPGWVQGVAQAPAGLLIAPGVLRRMARRESGSSMEARRLQHLQRV